MTNQDIEAPEAKLKKARRIRDNINTLRDIYLLYSGNVDELEILFSSKKAYIDNNLKGMMLELIQKCIKVEERKLEEME